MKSNVAAKARPVGFLSRKDKSSQPAEPQYQDREALITFDSGYSISMKEANHNLMVLGITGCGKTSTHTLPVLEKALKETMGGLIIDVKNNFTGSVRKLAATCGREADIIEIGTHDTAQPINILKCYSLDEQCQILESLIMEKVKKTNNVDWHFKGTGMVQQVCRTLYFIEKMRPGKGFAPSLALIARLINDQEMAQKTWKYFLSCMDHSNPDHLGLKARVESDNFSILVPAKTKSHQKDWDQQVAWRLALPRKFLEEFASGSLADNLSSVDGPGVDLEDLILRQKKMVVIRFSVKSGGPGNRLARMLKERFYSAVYSRFDHEDQISDHDYVLCLMDEFQDILHLDENSSLDDFSWVSKAREFKVINVMATQNMSSLYRSGCEHAVRSMLSNFGCKIIMQNDDAATDIWVENSFSPGIKVQDLGPGEAIVVKYALPERRLTVSIENAQQVHDSITSFINSLPVPETCSSWGGSGFDLRPVELFLRGPEWTRESEILEAIYNKAPEAFAQDSRVELDTENPQLAAGWAAVISKAAETAARQKIVILELSVSTNESKVKVDGSEQKITRFRKTVYRQLAGCCHICGAQHGSASRAQACCLVDDIDLELFDEELGERYGQILLNPFEQVSLNAVGWSGIIFNALDNIIQVSDKITIKNIAEHDNRLAIEADTRGLGREEDQLVQEIIRSASLASLSTCYCCGKPCQGKSKRYSVPVCPDCRKLKSGEPSSRTPGMCSTETVTDDEPPF